MDRSIAVERVEVPVWAWLVAAAAFVALYAITQENGALFAWFAEQSHELFHDGRHFLGVPCH